jgi:mono/diheme cytochrome c family protein
MSALRAAIAVALAVLLVFAVGFVWLRYFAGGFSALKQPSALETFFAVRARQSAMPPAASVLKDPVPYSEAVLAEARAHWADHCAVCHANNGSGDTEMGSHMYPRTPDMRDKRTQQLSDGELFFIIENGIRLSGMPGWHTPGQELASWKLVHFIRHLKQISPKELQEMEKLNPKGPDEREEEQQEQEFLNGGAPPTSKSPMHHSH